MELLAAKKSASSKKPRTRQVVKTGDVVTIQPPDGRFALSSPRDSHTATLLHPNCIRATAFDALSYGYSTAVITDATSASALVVAEANIRDMENIGIRCISFDEFKNEIA